MNSPLGGSLWQQPGHPSCLSSVCGVKLVSSRVGLWFVSPLQVLSFQSLPPPPVPHSSECCCMRVGGTVHIGPFLQPPSVAQTTRPSLLVPQQAQVCGLAPAGSQT